ncbi:MAG: nucleoside 2-deoxyribosyltransferase, partial [Promethearchaeota archaeon]
MKKKIYLAGGLGFSELGRYALDKLKEKFNLNFIISDPFNENSEFAEKIERIIHDTSFSIKEITEELQKINLKIGENNEVMIRNSDFILAILDGTDVDSGTAAEIGFAYAL